VSRKSFLSPAALLPKVPEEEIQHKARLRNETMEAIRCNAKRQKKLTPTQLLLFLIG